MVGTGTLWRAARRGRAGVGVILLATAAPRSAPAQTTDSAVVVTREELRGTGRATLAEALQVLIPSFNYPRPSGADLIDHVPPATLRGMRADQVLVLVDGKRRHPSAIVGLNPTIGRGETPTDLNAIPLAAIERVEVFGVGASLGFPNGSGTSAGVINIVLGSRLPRELVASGGLTTAGDGAAARIAGAYGIEWGSDGFIQLSAEYRGRGATNRARPDPREQFFPGDPRNSDPNFLGRIHERLGDSETRDLSGVVRFGKALRGGGGAELFGTLTGNRRRGESASLWRRPSEDGTVRALYPIGFRPLIHSASTDRSVDLGGRGRMGTGTWRWELSAGYGANTVAIEVRNTANASLGPLSPSRLSAGTLGGSELRADGSLAGGLSVGLAAPVTVLAGITVRREGYRIEAGERDSHRYGAVPIQDGPHAGDIAPVGAQGYPGFMPSDSFHQHRESVAGYAVVGLEPVRRLTLSAAGRTERYWSGDPRTQSTIAGAVRFEPVAGLVARGSAGTGYRVPSLPERWFTRTTVPVVNNVGLFDVLVPSAHSIARALGAFPLRAERSNTWSAGAGFRSRNGRTWVDAEYYRIGVRGRVGLTDRYTGPDLQSFLEEAGFVGVGAVRFFANVADTRTSGFEARAGYEVAVHRARVRFEAGFDHHRVRVERVDSAGGFLRQFPSVFFSTAERVRIESGQPEDNATLSALLIRPTWRTSLRARRYGQVRDFGPLPDGTVGQTFGAKWLADIEVSRTFRSRGAGLTLSAGAQNVLGVTPARNNQGDASFAGNSYFGILPYNISSPFGFNGRLVYVRAEWGY